VAFALDESRVPLNTSMQARWADSAETVAEAEAEAPQQRIYSMADWTWLAPEPRVGRLSFELFPPQEELYSEESADAEEIVVQKSTQCGITAWAWRWAARRVDTFGDTGIYIFPTDVHVRDFGDERIEPSIEASEYLRERIPRHYVKHKSLKRIGAGWLHLRGSNSRAGAQSVPAQLLVFDEYDELNQSNREQYERRLSGVRQQGLRPRVRRIGVPSIPGYGIAAQYQRSDRREWHVTCSECGHEQHPSWEDNMRWTMPGADEICRAGHDSFVEPSIVGDVWRACSSCETPLDVSKGTWIATNPGAGTIGYHLHRLIIPLADLKAVVVASRKTSAAELEAFWNNDLGRPYSPAEASLDELTINAAASMGREAMAFYTAGHPTTMGIDVASERALSVRISEQLPDGSRQAIYIGEVDSFQEVAELLERYNVHVAVIDSMPERRSARALAATYPGRVFLCTYDENLKDPWTLDVDRITVTANRTEAIDAMMDSIRQKRNRPLRTPPVGYVDQLKAPKRRTVLDTKGRPRRVYVSTGADDYAHTEVFDMIATELWRLLTGLQTQRDRERTPIPDEQLGFRRLRLDDLDSDDYQPGLGNDDYYPGFDGGGF